jgi:hypothetical protein
VQGEQKKRGSNKRGRQAHPSHIGEKTVKSLSILHIIDILAGF